MSKHNPIHSVLIVADPHASHTKRWANLLAAHGYRVLVFGLPEYDRENYRDDVLITTMGIDRNLFMSDQTGPKLLYIKALPKLRKTILEFQPDVLHAQYASSSGLLGALTRFHPFYISIWGTDIYDFPRTSFIHRKLIEFNLNSADKILSTSRDMANEASKYTNKEIIITPFGIDLEKFYPRTVKHDRKEIVIGTMKRLHKKYGIDNLMRAFKEVSKIKANVDLKLIVGGSGEEEQNLKQLSVALGIQHRVIFPGFIQSSEVAEFFRNLDIAVFLSHRESYGVAVLEASASGVPVIVTDIGGLPEVVRDGHTGIVIPDNNHEIAVQSLLKLVSYSDLRYKMGQEGRVFVEQNYSDGICNDKMLRVYNN